MINLYRYTTHHNYMVCFSSALDLYNYLKNASSVFGRLEYSQIEGTDAVASQGTYNFQDALSKLIYGDEECKELLASFNLDKIFKMAEEVKTKYKNDVVGFAPHVSNFLLNVPKSMISFRKRTKKRKTVSLLVEGAIVYSGSKDSFKNAGAIYRGVCVMALINWLESRGYRVEVYYVQILTDSACIRKPDRMSSVITTVKLKDYREPLNQLKMAFPFINLAFSKRLMFRVKEVNEKIPDFTNCRYGTGLADLMTFNYNLIFKDKKRLKEELSDTFSHTLLDYLDISHEELTNTSVPPIDRTAPFVLLERFPRGVYLPCNLAIGISPHISLEENIENLINYFFTSVGEKL